MLLLYYVDKFIIYIDNNICLIMVNTWDFKFEGCKLTEAGDYKIMFEEDLYDFRRVLAQILDVVQMTGNYVGTSSNVFTYEWLAQIL